MNLVWSAVVILVTTALAVTAMLLVRRSAPEGSRFKDGDRASGVFGVLATGFSVLLGFVVFLAFESYDQSRAGAEREALVLSQQVETAQFFGAGSADAHGRTGLLRPLGRRPRMAAHGVGRRRARGQPLGSRAVPHVQDHSSRKTPSEKRPMESGSTRPRTARRPDRPDPRSRRRDPDAAVDRAAPHLGRRLRLHAVLRRHGEGAADAGGVDGIGRHRHRLDAAPDRVPRPPLPQGSRRRPPGRDGEDAANRRRGAAGCRRAARPALRRSRESRSRDR